jgi:hypothetical protein
MEVGWNKLADNHCESNRRIFDFFSEMASKMRSFMVLKVHQQQQQQQQ